MIGSPVSTSFLHLSSMDCPSYDSTLNCVKLFVIILAYPNNYNYYVSYYRDTFQHGGISMEEMLIPLITLQSKKRN